MMSSGRSRGRDLVGGGVRSLGGNPSEFEAEIVANVDLASSLHEAGLAARSLLSKSGLSLSSKMLNRPAPRSRRHQGTAPTARADNFE